MSRKPREISKTGLYHVVNRGLGKQILFENEYDYKAFLEILKREIKITGISILAYCIMSNHFHFVIFDDEGCLSCFMQKIQERYAKYYNTKYLRSGYVFQGRFFSECILSMPQLVETIVYVHMNPQKAEICKFDEYKFSSYLSYKNKSIEDVIDFYVLESLVGHVEKMEDMYNHMMNNISIIESDYHKKTDDDGNYFIRNVLKLNNGRELQLLSKDKRDIYLKELKKYGLSIRQIERLTGIGRGVIQRVCR